jgi:hypothetical protein
LLLVLLQTWADTFISELNDTHIEADLRLRHTPPELDVLEVRSSNTFQRWGRGALGIGLHVFDCIA